MTRATSLTLGNIKLVSMQIMTNRFISSYIHVALLIWFSNSACNHHNFKNQTMSFNSVWCKNK